MIGTLTGEHLTKYKMEWGGMGWSDEVFRCRGNLGSAPGTSPGILAYFSVLPEISIEDPDCGLHVMVNV